MEDERKRAFVIHGHNEVARLQLCEMLEAEFNFRPVVLARQPALGRTIIELFEECASECVLAVALLTADDVSNNADRASIRARQNVIFELGYFCASLGRDKVCLVYQEGVELPSDLSGMIYYPFRASVHEVYPLLRKHIEQLHLLDQTDSAAALLVVDDDLVPSDPLIRRLQMELSAVASVEVVQDPDEAIRILSSGRKLLGCLTDIVFRRHSSVAGVRIAEAAIRNRIPVIAVTGHKREDLGVAYTELTRIGVSENNILSKPVTLKQYRSFLGKVKRILGEL